jgi:hypothetical protein
MKKLLVVLAACGGSSDKPPIVLIDSQLAVDAPPIVTGGTNVDLMSFGPAPLLLALRDGDGAWTALPATASSFHVAKSTYELLAVCMAGTLHQTGIIQRAADDGSQQMPCFNFGSSTAPNTVAITGMVAQPGSVFMYDTKSGTTSPWSYALDVTTGPHDLIAAGATKIAIQRGLNITVAAAEPTIDITATGTAYDQETMTVANVGAATLTSQVDWLTTNEFAQIAGTGANVNLIPDALLGTQDFVVLDMVATNGKKTRTAEQFPSSSALVTDLTLLDELGTITYTGLSAQWTTLPPGITDVSLQISSPQGFLGIDASPGFYGSKTSIATDLTGVPGYDATWTPTTAPQHDFAVSLSVGGVTQRSTITDATTTSMFRDKRAELQRLRARR